MIALPDGFDLAGFVNELFQYAVPFAAIAFVLCAYAVIKKIFKVV